MRLRAAAVGHRLIAGRFGVFENSEYQNRVSSAKLNRGEKGVTDGLKNDFRAAIRGAGMTTMLGGRRGRW